MTVLLLPAHMEVLVSILLVIICANVRKEEGEKFVIKVGLLIQFSIFTLFANTE